MTASSTDLKNIFAAGHPLVERAIDLSLEMAALREVATGQGIDWSQVKALLKAQILDERDDSGDHKRLNKVLEKAEFATAYADMLGLTPNMNEKNFSVPVSVAHCPLTGEITEPYRHDGPTAVPEAGGVGERLPLVAITAPPADFPDLPPALDRRRHVEAVR